jgi:SAM-dependent methyltransferase
MSGPIAYSRIAALYDTFVQVNFDIPFFLQEAQKASGEVLELMAGTGRVSIPLIEAGVRLTCVDISEEMLEVLKGKLIERKLQAELFQMDVCNLNLERQFELIFIPFHSFAEILSTQDQLSALVRIHDHLTPSGRFICTLHNPPIRSRSVDGRLQLWGKFPLKDRPGKLLFWGVQNFDPTGRIVEGMEFFEDYDEEGILIAKKALEIRFCLLTRGEIEELAKTAGFMVENLFGDYSYSKFDGNTSPYMIWVLKKT